MASPPIEKPGTNRGGFKPGQSGNPGGRPKWLKDVQDLARGHAVECITGLMNIANSEDQPGAARVAAYNAVLDRALGKPKQTVGMDEDGPAIAGFVLIGSREEATSASWLANHKPGAPPTEE